MRHAVSLGTLRFREVSIQPPGRSRSWQRTVPGEFWTQCFQPQLLGGSPLPILLAAVITLCDVVTYAISLAATSPNSVILLVRRPSDAVLGSSCRSLLV